uniref:Uncharacterized protein n=1 Tax=Parascaris univalens TaxID=6257 RepID=A0A915BGD3_PARUN
MLKREHNRLQKDNRSVSYLLQFTGKAMNSHTTSNKEASKPGTIPAVARSTTSTAVARPNNFPNRLTRNSRDESALR